MNIYAPTTMLKC